jgi:transcriptional regulator with XRE-family HTH domain
MLLIASNMTRKDFARRMNICEGVISNWIKGVRPVPTDRIYQAARVLKVTPAALVTPREISENILRFRPREDVI